MSNVTFAESKEFLIAMERLRPVDVQLEQATDEARRLKREPKRKQRRLPPSGHKLPTQRY